MAFFGRKPEKPGSVPGSQSGDREKRAMSRVRGAVARVERARPQGRAVRNTRSSR